MQLENQQAPANLYTASELGKKSAYPASYNKELLFPLPRQNKRAELGLTAETLPFRGVDVWNHYEVSWLNSKGKPQVAMAVLEIAATSLNIIESKSMKLYFNSFNNTRFNSTEQVRDLIQADLSQAVASEVKVSLYSLDEISQFAIVAPCGQCLDDLDIAIDEYRVAPQLLQVEGEAIVSESIYSNLLKSNCLVTEQPDWATVMISYRGRLINHEQLLKYIISFRNHNEFHEQCVERIFTDIWQQCQPLELTVTARFTRRGGLDINPTRTSLASYAISNLRLIRQ